MPNAGITIVVDDSNAQQLLASLDKAFSAPELEMLLAGPVAVGLQQRAERRFESEGDATSGKWAELKQSTQLIRTLLGYSPSHPINVRDGDLRNFVTHTMGTVTPVADGAELNWPGPPGAVTDKFRVAQQGSPAGENPWFNSAEPTPPRPVVAFDEVDVAELLGLMSVHLAEHMTSAGFTVAPL